MNIVYKINQANGRFMIGGGPTIGIPFNETYNYGSNKYKTDLGINGVVGFETTLGFGIHINYTYGLLNVSNNKQYINKVSNRYLGFTVGYTF